VEDLVPHPVAQPDIFETDQARPLVAAPAD
jgi:hypothetical protein